MDHKTLELFLAIAQVQHEEPRLVTNMEQQSIVVEEETDLYQLTELLIGLMADTKINEEMVGLDNDKVLEVCDYLPDGDTWHHEVENHQLVGELGSLGVV